MNCKKCGSPLPNEGVVCKFCGAAMEQSQLQAMSKMNEDKEKKITLLSEKYGRKNDIEYEAPKQNNLVGILVVVLIIVFLITLAIIIK